MYFWNFSPFVVAKGQYFQNVFLVSSLSSKRQMKTSRQVVKSNFSFIFGRNVGLKKSFWFCLTFKENETILQKMFQFHHWIRFLIFLLKEWQTIISGLELARVTRVPGTGQNSEHHLRHSRILRFLILTGTCRDHSM